MHFTQLTIAAILATVACAAPVPDADAQAGCNARCGNWRRGDKIEARAGGGGRGGNWRPEDIEARAGGGGRGGNWRREDIEARAGGGNGRAGNWRRADEVVEREAEPLWNSPDAFTIPKEKREAFPEEGVVIEARE